MPVGKATLPASSLVDHDRFVDFLKTCADGALALAVSGGRDSIALLRIAVATRPVHGRALFAFTVDHQLRSESREEARWVGALCEKLGVHHKILPWVSDKPTTGIQAAARAARYRLLCEACNELSIPVLLTAHTADDQAETVFMRQARSDDPRGLAGMRAHQYIASGAGEPVTLGRPLLDQTRQSFTAYLADLGQDFIDDPSNDDEQYERVRARRTLSETDEGSLKTKLLALADESRILSEEACTEENTCFHRNGGVFFRNGSVSVAATAFREGDGSGLARRIIHAVGGSEHAPARQATSSVMAKVNQSASGVIAGAMIARRGGRFIFHREPAALLGRADRPAIEPIPLTPNKPFLWDRRFILRVNAGGHNVSALGRQYLKIWHRTLKNMGQIGAIATSPAIFSNKSLISAPAGLFQNVSISADQPTIFFNSLIEERFFRRVVRF